MNRRLVAAGTFFAGALVLAGCTDDGADADLGTEETPVGTIATGDAGDDQMTDDAGAEGDTIVDIAAGNPELSTLVTALETAGLAETLSGEGPYTVFAPTNNAFSDPFPDTLLDTLFLPENSDVLASILTYHVVEGEVLSTDLENGEVMTLSGDPLEVSTDGGVTVGRVASVVEADIEASNGVIHIIDNVLIPPGVDVNQLGQDASPSPTG